MTNNYIDVLTNLVKETYNTIFTWYYILMIFLLYILMYRKKVSMCTFLYDLFISVIIGCLVGYIGILVGVYLNISINLMSLIPITIILAFINKRYTCLAYSGAIISVFAVLSHEATIDYRGIIGLVALFHLIESLLILTINPKEAKLSIVQQKDELKKCYEIEKTWIVPFSILLINNTMIIHQNELFNVKIFKYLSNSIVFSLLMFSVVLVVGFGTIAVKTKPKQKILNSGLELLIYSLTILFIYISSKKLEYMSYIGIIIMPLMHELFIIKNQLDEI